MQYLEHGGSFRSPQENVNFGFINGIKRVVDSYSNTESDSSLQKKFPIDIRENAKKLKRSKSVLRIQDEVTEDLNIFLKNCGLSKASFYGEICSAYRDTVLLIYCKENNIGNSELLFNINSEDLSNNGKKILKEISTAFRKARLDFSKLEHSKDFISESLKEGVLESNLKFFQKLVKEKDWNFDEALDAVSATYPCIKNYSENSDFLLKEINTFQSFVSNLVPFSKIVQLQNVEHPRKRWKIRQISSQEISLFDYPNKRIITASEWKIWLRTLATNYILLNGGREKEVLLKDLSYLYCDMLMTPNRNDCFLNHSSIINLFSTYCSYLEKQIKKNPHVGAPIYLFSEQEVTDYNRRKRIVRSILDGKWYDVFERVTNINPEDLLHQKLIAVDKNPKCNFTLGEFLSQIYPEAINNGKLLENFTIKKLFDLNTIIDSTDGKTKNNGYYHTSRYVIKSNLPLSSTSVEVRIHGADRFSYIANTCFLPCIKITLITDNGCPICNYCFFSNEEGENKSGWYAVEDVNNDMILLAASHILFTPKEDIFGNPC